MALSKDKVRPYFPKDLSHVIVNKKAATATSLTAGDLVVEVSGQIVLCDTGTAVHKTLPPYMVWTDGTRTDISEIELDGTEVNNFECLSGHVKADLHDDLFVTSPAAGNVLIKSGTAGKIDHQTASAFATSVGTSADHVLLVVGRCESTSQRLESDANFYNCTLTLQ